MTKTVHAAPLLFAAILLCSCAGERPILENGHEPNPQTVDIHTTLSYLTADRKHLRQSRLAFQFQETPLSEILTDLFVGLPIEVSVHNSVDQTAIPGSFEAGPSLWATLDKLKALLQISWHLGPNTVFIDGQYGESNDVRVKANYRVRARDATDLVPSRGTLEYFVIHSPLARGTTFFCWTGASTVEVDTFQSNHVLVLEQLGWLGVDKQ
jgi:hypothetical protein